MANGSKMGDKETKASTNPSEQNGGHNTNGTHSQSEDYINGDLSGNLTDSDLDQSAPEFITERGLGLMPSIKMNELEMILRDPNMPSSKIMREVADRMVLNYEYGENEEIRMKGLFDYILEVIYEQTSPNSSDDEDGECFQRISRRIPCSVCNRVFDSTMTCMTHVLMAHQHPSMLNIKRKDDDDRRMRAHGSHIKLSRAPNSEVDVEDIKTCFPTTDIDTKNNQSRETSIKIGRKGTETYIPTTEVGVKNIHHTQFITKKERVSQPPRLEKSVPSVSGQSADSDPELSKPKDLLSADPANKTSSPSDESKNSAHFSSDSSNSVIQRLLQNTNIILLNNTIPGTCKNSTESAFINDISVDTKDQPSVDSGSEEQELAHASQGLFLCQDERCNLEQEKVVLNNQKEYLASDIHLDAVVHEDRKRKVPSPLTSSSSSSSSSKRSRKE